VGSITMRSRRRQQSVVSNDRSGTAMMNTLETTRASGRSNRVQRGPNRFRRGIDCTPDAAVRVAGRHHQ